MPSLLHDGERQVQARLGVAEQVATFAHKFIRNHLIDQHREFYAQLPLLLLGTVDEAGRPWASLVAGTPGFLTTPDELTLNIAANPLTGDPLHHTLKEGADVGVLGLQLETRRRNRMTGRVKSLTPDHISIAVHQSFGNCPKYIQTRAVSLDAETQHPRPLANAGRFSAAVRSIIAHADTLFIASAYAENKDDVAHGADVSHRGGKPGFVRLEDDRTFVFPDFSGNNLFNTIGNLVLNPKAGFLFPDFDTGDLVYMTGTTEIIWDGPEVDAFKGANRMLRFRADEVLHVEASLPMRFSFGEYAPNLKATGDWSASPGTAR
ncbi:MAG: flavin-nucleotide-binding protein [Alphaproteobacteria bacterium]|nr:flavin-nucleotide-binding protein [Alphaproteobacteria bacterium]